MSMDANAETTSLSPDEAFATLSNETRMAVLRTLGEHDGDPLSFTELHDAVDMRDSGQFNYHLDQLVGHFVSKTDDGYELRRAGQRVIEAVLSGAVTTDPVVERTEIDHACHYCGAPLEMSFRGESTATYCTNCAGAFDLSDDNADQDETDDEYGFMGYLHLPPAGLSNRSPSEVHSVAFTWQLSENLPASNGVCPRCSAPMEEEAPVCENHESDEGGICEACGNRHAVQFVAECTNCIFQLAGPFVNKLTGSTPLIAFLADHGINPVAPSPERVGQIILDYEESVHSASPLDAAFTFEVENDSLTVRVDGNLEIVELNNASRTE